MPHVAQFEQFAVRVVLWFLENPEEELASGDMAIKFAYAADTVHAALRPAIAAGWLARDAHGRRVPAVFRAGPRLLRALGRPVADDKAQPCAS
jgi:hypothetical protein